MTYEDKSYSGILYCIQANTRLDKGLFCVCVEVFKVCTTCSAGMLIKKKRKKRWLAAAVSVNIHTRYEKKIEIPAQCDTMWEKNFVKLRSMTRHRLDSGL